VTVFILSDIADLILAEPALWDRPRTPDDAHRRIAMHRAHLLISAAIFLNLDVPMRPAGPTVITVVGVTSGDIRVTGPATSPSERT
jgi:hypothetical protein